MLLAGHERIVPMPNTYAGPERRRLPVVTTDTHPPDRRHLADSESDRRSLVRIVASAVEGMMVTPFVRVICAILSLSYVFMAWDPLFNPNDSAYERPLFDAVFAFASPLAWGVGFAICAVTLMLAAITGRAVIYLLGILVSVTTMLAWASMIIYQSWENAEAHLTSGAYGLYTATLVGVVGLAFSPRQLNVEKPIIAVLEDDGDAIVRPLKRIERTG